MKKLLLFACTIGAFSAFAQKDVAATFLTPADGYNVQAGVPFDVSFTVTNAGSTALAATDSVYFGITVGGGSIFGGYIYWAETSNTALAPGASYTYTLEDVAFNTIPSNLSGNQDMCVVLYLYEGTAPQPTTEGNMTNNTDCNTVNFTPGTVGINELAGFNNNISLFPNPATDKVTFSTEGATATTANIYSISGALAATVVLEADGTTEFNASELTSGMYVVNFVAANGSRVATQKLTVK